ncbi:zygote arrest protein 1.S-like [Acipenser ruthenus]|uniref:zygote arrest protein 1.S-like n=1 Tax=Acipenser ruthenus TaxID=7906 RepID=UPI00145BE34A|nr:zygote arrest protein 1.S-like [Acipenser ruthenus]
MATYDDESDSYLYSYNPYSYRYLNPKPKGLSWRQKSYLSSYGDSGEYFDNYQRAHLKSILSQINPNLTPRLRKANTKDVGIQVNPKTDASVQCSLGPRTLVASKREALRWRRPTTPITGSPVNNLAKTVRFPRTLALYSPIAARRPPSFLEEKYDREKPEGDPPETTEKVQVQDDDTKSTLEEKEASPAYDKDSMKTDTGSGVGAAQENDSSGAQKEGQDGNRSRARVRFQFLEQKYGYYHCRECNLRWESAYVWCVQGTNKVYFKQFCRTCQKAFNPYRVEDITCQVCKRARCICTVTMRHVDPKRPHRQDLCGRCKGKRLSCDSTFSFKYII